MSFELRRDYRFESARRLPHIPEGHPCARVHGHSFRVRVKLAGDLLQPQGWVLDFADIDKVVEPVIAELDHQYLNDLDGLENPTSEWIARWVWARLAPSLPGLVSVRISETESSSVTYSGG